MCRTTSLFCDGRRYFSGALLETGNIAMGAGTGRRYYYWSVVLPVEMIADAFFHNNQYVMTALVLGGQGGHFLRT